MDNNTAVSCFKIPENINLIITMYFKGITYSEIDVIKREMLMVTLKSINRYLYDPDAPDLFDPEDIANIVNRLLSDYKDDFWKKVLIDQSDTGDLEDIVNKLTKVVDIWCKETPILCDIVTTRNYWNIVKLTDEYFLLCYNISNTTRE